MNRVSDQVAVITDGLIEEIPRAAELGQLDFSAAARTVTAIRRMATAFAIQDEDDLPSGLVDQSIAQLDTLSNVIGQMKEFRLQDDNAASTHTALEAQVNGVREWFAINVRPHIQGQQVDLLARTAEANQLLEAARATTQEAEQLIAKVRQAAGEQGAGKLSSYYQNQAKTHAGQAKTFLKVAVGTAIATALLAVWLFTSLKVDATAASSVRWAELVHGVVVRVFFLGLLSYVLGFTVRAYRVNMHLQVVNEQRRNALDTYGLFSEAAKTEEAHDLITVELIKAVFSGASTGFLEDTQEKTIIDSQATGLMGLLLNRTPR